MTVSDITEARRTHAAALLGAGLTDGWMVQTYDTVYASWSEVLRVYPNAEYPERALVLIVNYSHCGTVRTTDLLPVGDLLKASPREDAAGERLFFREGCVIGGDLITWPTPLTADSWVTTDRPQLLSYQDIH